MERVIQEIKDSIEYYCEVMQCDEEFIHAQFILLPCTNESCDVRWHPVVNKEENIELHMKFNDFFEYVYSGKKINNPYE